MSNKYNWMQDAPLGSLESTRDTGNSNKYPPPLVNLSKEKRDLIEDHKSGFLSKAELAIALSDLDAETQRNRFKAFLTVNIPSDCTGCPELLTIPDAYATGDSPTGYDCRGSAKVCPAID